jgi:phosphotransferase system enzyme I (PtsI)
MDLERSRREKLYKGIPISPSVHIGIAIPVGPKDIVVPTGKISQEEVREEIKRFEEVRREMIKSIEEVKRELDPKLGELMDSQIMILKDPNFIDSVREMIEKRKRKAEYAIQRTLADMAEKLEHKGTEYMRERAGELRNLAREMIKRLLREEKSQISMVENGVLIANDLSIQDTIRVIKAGISAIALGEGGKTSHTAIIVRNYKIPAVFGLGNITEEIKEGDIIIVDGAKGVIILNPKNSTIEQYRKRKKEYEAFTRELLKHKDEPPQTKDGREITLLANIDFPEELDVLKEYGSCGIGLFRTEVIFSTLYKDEEKQYKLYKKIAEQVYPCPFVIRAFDIGGDKIYDYKEKNPFLGFRGIRVLLKERKIFETQIRALLKANKLGNIKFMIPMVSAVEEVAETKEIMEEIYRELKESGYKDINFPDFGIMVETPSSALLADKFAPYVDFMSIGTNDLTQYLLAVDRRSPKVSYLFDHLHPSLLRLIKTIVEICHEKNIWVGVCGEMASDPYGIPLLLGLEVDELSVTPALLLETKEMIRGVYLEELKPIVEKCLNAESSDEVRKIVGEFLHERFPKVLMFYPI